jgi:hypothetical protein
MAGLRDPRYFFDQRGRFGIIQLLDPQVPVTPLTGNGVTSVDARGYRPPTQSA